MRVILPDTRTQATPLIPIFKDEILEYFDPEPGCKYLDLTFGTGSHSKLILDSSPGIELIACDCDSAAAERAKEYRSSEQQTDAENISTFISYRAKFSEIPHILRETNHKLGKQQKKQHPVIDQLVQIYTLKHLGFFHKGFRSYCRCPCQEMKSRV